MDRNGSVFVIFPIQIDKQNWTTRLYELSLMLLLILPKMLSYESQIKVHFVRNGAFLEIIIYR